MRQARTCRLHNARRPHTYPRYIRDRAPGSPRAAAPAAAPQAGGGGRGRAPAVAPAEPFVNPLPVAFTRHGTFPERANVPPTSGNSLRGAARTRTPAPTRTPAELPAHMHSPCDRRPPAAPREDCWQPEPHHRHPPLLPACGRPQRRVAWAPRPPPRRVPPLQGTGGR